MSTGTKHSNLPSEIIRLSREIAETLPVGRNRTVIEKAADHIQRLCIRVEAMDKEYVPAGYQHRWYNTDWVAISEDAYIKYAKLLEREPDRYDFKIRIVYARGD